MAGIYLHIPFCKQACHYCDFHFSTSLKKKDELLEALIKELQLRKHELHNQTVETIYFGGGTPSLLSEQELKGLLEEIHKNFFVSDNPEVTLEANPDDLIARSDSKNVFEVYREIGINRLSIGIQSFFEDDLQQMNRAHNAQEAIQCLKLATQYFDNITIDLIYGIPNMSIANWIKNLETAFDFGINHISSYALTVEPKTALASYIKNGNYPQIDETLALEHFNKLVELTEKEGYIHYEISNFGKPEYFSKHNTSYWQGKPYLGIGPSAHSFNGATRSWNLSNNSKYIFAISNNELPSEQEILSRVDRFNEYVMTGLRTIWGISLSKVEQEFGNDFKDHLLKAFQKFESQNLLEVENDCLKTTQKGKFLVDGIASELFMI